MINLIVAASMAGCCVGSHQGAVQIKRVPSPGISWYRETSKFGLDDGRFEISVLKKVEILPAAGGGYLEKTAVLPNDDPDRPFDGFATVRRYASDGMLVDNGDQSPPVDRRGANLALIFVPAEPVHAGETWTRTFKGFGSDEFETKCDFKFDGVEEVDGVKCASIEFSQQESVSHCSCHGKAWLDLSDGELVKKTFELKSVPAGGQQIVDGETVILRVPDPGKGEQHL